MEGAQLGRSRLFRPILALFVAIAVAFGVAPVAKAVSVGDEVTTLPGPGYGLTWKDPESTGTFLPRLF